MTGFIFEIIEVVLFLIFGILSTQLTHLSYFQKIAIGILLLLTVIGYLFKNDIILFLEKELNIHIAIPHEEASKTEQIFWDSIEKHPSQKGYEAYLKKYPDGEFKILAEQRLAELTKNDSTIPIDNTEKAQGLNAQKLKDLNEKLAQVEREKAQQAQRAKLAKEQAEQEKQLREQLAKAEREKAEQMRLTKLAEQEAENERIRTQQQKESNEWQTIQHYQVKDGLVKDTKTGLMWMRCSMGQEWNGSTCSGDAKKCTWDNAMNIPDSFNYAGYSDWRVPTIDELKSLIYCSSGKTKTLDDGRWYCDGDYTQPTIVQVAFPNTLDNFVNGYWSSSPVANNSNNPWVVSFYDGSDGWNYKSYGSFVRLVRGGQ